MKKIIYIVLLLLLISSCSTGYDNARLIAGDSCQFWFWPTADSIVKAKFYIYFNRKGKMFLLKERFHNKEISLYDGGDVAYYPKWSLKNDSIITWFGRDRKLSVINDTVIVTKDEEWQCVDTLYKVTDTSLLKKLQEVKIPRNQFNHRDRF